MSKKFIKRLMAALTAALMTAGMSAPVFAEEPSDSEPVTREYVVSEFVQSIGRNLLTSNDSLSSFSDADDIDKQYIDDFSKAVSNGLITRGAGDNTLRPRESITRVEALVILSRCLPELEEVREEIVFTDVPDWAAEDISRLTKGGIVNGYGNGLLGSDDLLTAEQANLLTDRSDEVLNTVDVGESFYGYANNKLFRNANIASIDEIDVKHGVLISTTGAWSTFLDIARKINNDETDMLRRLMNGEIEYENNTAEQRIHDFLLTVADDSGLTQADIDMLTEFREYILNCSNIEELMSAAGTVCEKTGVNPLFAIKDALDSRTARISPTFGFYDPGYAGLNEFNKKYSKQNAKIYKKALKMYFDAIGYDVTEKDIDDLYNFQVTASEDVNFMSEMQQGLMLKTMTIPGYTKEDADRRLKEIAADHPNIDPNTFADKTAVNKEYTHAEANRALSTINAGDIIENIGFSSDDTIIFATDKAVKDCAKLFTNGNLKILKMNALLALDQNLEICVNDEEKAAHERIKNFALTVMMDEEIDEQYLQSSLEELAPDDANSGLLNIDKDDILSDKNMYFLRKYLPNAMGAMYAHQYYDESTTAVIEKMVDDLLAAYAKRFENGWMTKETKAKALAKIKNMASVIGFSDEYAKPVISSPEDGGTLFKNLVHIQRRSLDEIIMICNDESVMRKKLVRPADTLNASYLPTFNMINVFAGILNAPIYDKDADYAANLGAIGSVIGHEIGHGFGSRGAEYDEYGRRINWWTPEDRAIFEEKKQQVIDYYKNYDVVDGVVQDSTLTLSENMADLAGMRCVMDILEGDPEAQKEALESYAHTWARLGTIEYVTDSKFLNDVHSSNNVRVDAVVSSIDEFYELYDISEDDPMYVAPEDRIKLW